MDIFISLLMLILLPLMAILIFKALPLWIAGKVAGAQNPGLFRAMWTYLILYVFLILVLLIIFKGNVEFETSSLALVVCFDSLCFLTGAVFLKKSFGVSDQKILTYLMVGVLTNIAVAAIVWYLISAGGLVVINQMLVNNGIMSFG